MTPYPKKILYTVNDQISELENSGLVIKDRKKVEEFLSQVNYYRFRGFLFPFYDNASKKYIPGTSIDTVIDIYCFNSELASVILRYLSKIEIALRAHLVEALVLSGDALSYMDASYIADKHDFWTNMSLISNEINRSSDIFIKHQFDGHGGLVPVWAAVEVMSFGTLSKFICSLGNTNPRNSLSKIMYQKITSYYQYTTNKNNSVLPKPEIFSSWLRCAVLVRNICAHNSRLYDRSITKKPELLRADAKQKTPTYYGVYEALLALKYIRSSDTDWRDFVADLIKLISKYSASISLSSLNFPSDWKNHFIV